MASACFRLSDLSADVFGEILQFLRLSHVVHCIRLVSREFRFIVDTSPSLWHRHYKRTLGPYWRLLRENVANLRSNPILSRFSCFSSSIIDLTGPSLATAYRRCVIGLSTLRVATIQCSGDSGVIFEPKESLIPPGSIPWCLPRKTANGVVYDGCITFRGDVFAWNVQDRGRSSRRSPFFMSSIRRNLLGVTRRVAGELSVHCYAIRSPSHPSGELPVDIGFTRTSLLILTHVGKLYLLSKGNLQVFDHSSPILDFNVSIRTHAFVSRVQTTLTLLDSTHTIHESRSKRQSFLSEFESIAINLQPVSTEGYIFPNEKIDGLIPGTSGTDPISLLCSINDGGRILEVDTGFSRVRRLLKFRPFRVRSVTSSSHGIGVVLSDDSVFWKTEGFGSVYRRLSTLGEGNLVSCCVVLAQPSVTLLLLSEDGRLVCSRIEEEEEENQRRSEMDEVALGWSDFYEQELVVVGLFPRGAGRVSILCCQREPDSDSAQSENGT